MTTKEFIALEKSLLPDLPDFAVKGPLMFIPPAERLLRGISFEGSSFDKTSFYVTVFVMPLCIPTKHLYFNLVIASGTKRARIAGARECPTWSRSWELQ